PTSHVRLKSALTLHSLSAAARLAPTGRDEFLILCVRRGKCQRTATILEQRDAACVTFVGFAECHVLTLGVMSFGFLPKFSTTVENTVENRPSQTIYSVDLAISLGFRCGESRAWPIFGPS